MKKIVVALLIVICLFFIIRKAVITDQKRIKKIIASTEQAIENKSLLKSLSYISFDYSDNLGNDYHSLSYLLRSGFRTYQDIFIHIRGLKVELQGDEAVASLVANVVATRSRTEKEELLTEKGAERFVVTFRKENGRWKIIKAEIPQPTFE